MHGLVNNVLLSRRNLVTQPFFCFIDLHLFKGSCLVYGFVSNVYPSRRNLVTQPFFVSLTYTYFKDLVQCMYSSVTYICQGRILLLISLTFPLKGLCKLDRFVSNLHPSWQNLIIWPFDLPLKGFCLFGRFVSNLHLSRRNLVTWPFDLPS